MGVLCCYLGQPELINPFAFLYLEILLRNCTWELRLGYTTSVVVSYQIDKDKRMKQNMKQDIKQDRFIARFLEKLPADQQQSFSDEQLQAVKMAFGARSWGAHAVDFRGTFSFFRWRYYFVFLMGRNVRTLSRREQKAYRFATAMFISIFIVISTLFGLLVLYLIKSAAGIDLIPGFSLGIWAWFKDLF